MSIAYNVLIKKGGLIFLFIGVLLAVLIFKSSFSLGSHVAESKYYCEKDDDCFWNGEECVSVGTVEGGKECACINNTCTPK